MAVSLIALSWSAYAETNIGWRSIMNKQIYRNHTGVLYKTDYMVANGCSRNDWYILPKSHVYYSEIYKSLEIVRITGKTVDIVLEGCYEGMPQIWNITVD